jgi:c-di-GMP-binding flagellar brake protein YcgR
MTIQKNRRQFWRAHFHSPVQLAAHGQVSEADLYDISLKGALLKVPDGWAGKLGDRCQLRLSLAANATISMSATIVHVAGRRVGLHCDNIDVDSVTHLRRLVALNSGDPKLLDRELASLLVEATD